MTKDKVRSTEEALRLALEALETPWNAPYVDGCDLALGKKVKAITAIKEALMSVPDGAQPEQPPYHHFVSDRFNIDPQTGNLNIGAVKKQEPVAWISPKELLVMRGNAYAGAKDWRVNLGLEPEEGDVGLYTTPPQRTWVGLTDGEVDKMILLMGFPPDWITENAIVKNIVRNLEAKLKDKNT